MTEGLDVLFGWLGVLALLVILAMVMHRYARRR
jgi:hypothetical protein